MNKTSRPHDDAVVELLHEDLPLPMNIYRMHWMKSISPGAVKPC
jgi:hypothetical protein